MTIIEFVRSLPEAEKDYLLNHLIRLLLAPDTIPVTNDELVEMLDLTELKKTSAELYR